MISGTHFRIFALLLFGLISAASSAHAQKLPKNPYAIPPGSEPKGDKQVIVQRAQDLAFALIKKALANAQAAVKALPPTTAPSKPATPAKPGKAPAPKLSEPERWAANFQKLMDTFEKVPARAAPPKDDWLKCIETQDLGAFFRAENEGPIIRICNRVTRLTRKFIAQTVIHELAHANGWKKECEASTVEFEAMKWAGHRPFKNGYVEDECTDLASKYTWAEAPNAGDKSPIP